MAPWSGRNRRVAAVSRSSGARCAWSTGRSEQLTRRLGALCLAERNLRDPAHQLRVVPAGDLRHAGQTGVVVQVRIGVEDRKSTRLNSSHSQISYAVFCLKKKTTQTNLRQHAHSRSMLQMPS